MAWSSLRLASVLVVAMAGGAVGCASRPLVDLTGGAGGQVGGIVADGGRDARPDRIPPDLLLPDAHASFCTGSPSGDSCCGNGHLDPGEQCDDGNLASGDGCSRLCQVECNFRCGSCGSPNPCIAPDDGGEALGSCGDGIVDTSAGETCDLGTANGSPGSPCTSNCQISIQ